ncbi:hypothetical protein AeMF1_018119 [Aphanomyces euteiches]|nr:hypothetical protein AeMF1_018119 [Aphanomyces euteiches]
MYDEVSAKRKTILPSPPRRHYFIRDRIRLIELYDMLGIPNGKKLCLEENVPRTTFLGWSKERQLYMSHQGSGKRMSLDGQGCHEVIPFGQELVTFMKDIRREEHILTTAHMVTWMKTHHPFWIDAYLANKKNDERGYSSLMHLYQRFAHRHGFSQRVACLSRLKQEKLEEIQADFSQQFWEKYDGYNLSEILNVDETSVYYDMPSRRTGLKLVVHRKLTSQKGTLIYSRLY